MKIYDCFRYCGEELLLNLRLKTLYDEVDKFVIIEGDKYYNGETKKQLFDINKFKDFKKKIDYYFIDNFPIYNAKNNDPNSEMEVDNENTEVESYLFEVVNNNTTVLNLNIIM